MVAENHEEEWSDAIGGELAQVAKLYSQSVYCGLNKSLQ
jgi:hypothetical protein